MNAQSLRQEDTLDTSADANTLRMKRVFDASRERVFEAWTNRSHFIQWMCPPHVKIATMEIDVRPGGAWRIGGTNEGRRVFASSGKYLEVTRPQRLVFTWAHHQDGDFARPRGHETTVTIELRALGAKTELTLTHGVFLDGYGQHKSGWEGSFDKLGDYLRRAA